MSGLERILGVASLMGRPLDLEVFSDEVVAHRASQLVDAGLAPVAAIRTVRREVLTTQGFPPREAATLSDALLVGRDVQLECRVVSERYVGRYGSIELLVPEPRADRLVRTLLSEGPCSAGGLRRVARAIGLGEVDIAAARSRVGAAETRDSVSLGVRRANEDASGVEGDNRSAIATAVAKC